MARHHGQSAIYEVAGEFARDCFLADGSFLWPGREIWTLQNLDQLWSVLIENPDIGDDGYFTKLEGQLAGQSDDVCRLMAEVTAFYSLFPSSLRADTKQSLVKRIAEFGPGLDLVDEDRWKLLLAAFESDGIGSTGTSYNTARDGHIGAYIEFARQVKSNGYANLSEIDRRRISDTVISSINAAGRPRPFSTVNIFLHMLWPDEYEGTLSNDLKGRMATNLSAHFGLPDLDDVDEAILQARKHMEANGFEPNFSMYDSEIEPLWNYIGSKPPKPVSRTVSKKFDLASLFRERVLEKNKSFLWPDEERVWTLEHAETAFAIVRSIDKVTIDEAFGEIAERAKQQPRAIYMVLSDLRAVLILIRRVSSNIARMHMGLFDLENQAPDFDRQVLEDLFASSNDSFPGNFDDHWKMFEQLTTVMTGILALLRHPESQGNRDQMHDAYMAEIPEGNSGLLFSPMFSLFYLLYPDQFAPAFFWNRRNELLQAFQLELEVQNLPNQLAQLAFIREKLDPDFDPYTFDFYASPWKEMWQPGPQDDEGKVGIEPPPVTDPEPPIAFVPPTIDDLAGATFLETDFLGEIESLLKSRKQLIFEGPPGSGKTFVAEKFARYFTGQSLTEKRNETIELVQFHQSYSYEDFMEGIRPETIDGQLHYNVKPGIFRRFAERAAKNPDQNFVMIIDEINRGNVSRILGELMLLLEYRNESATLPYSQEPFEIPKNLYIIGTMNSADRSLSQIDYALRRRFYFLRFLAVEGDTAPVLRGWLQQQEMEEETRQRILRTFIKLNHQLRAHLETDDMQVGHSYFMQPDIHDEEFRTRVWKYAVVPLIREYLYHHRDRDDLLKGYEYEAMRIIIQPIAEETQIPADELAQGSSNEAEMP